MPVPSPHLDSANRRRALITVIASISVVGLSLGMTIPLVSLSLERMGVSNVWIGLMAAMPAIGIFTVSLTIPTLVRRFGPKSTLLGALVVSIVAIVLLPLFQGQLMVWLVLRLLIGAADGCLFVISETWINEVVEEHQRGRALALYATVLSFATATGPVLLAVVGSEGVAPFLMAAIISAVAGLPMLSLRRNPPLDFSQQGFGVLGFVAQAPTLCCGVVLFAFLDACGFSLLPLFGLRHGYDEATAALMVTALLGGNTLFQLPIGWLADRLNRQRLLGILGGMILGMSLLLPVVVNHAWGIWPTLVLLGASAGGVYTLVLILVGQRFRGPDLVTANATFGLLWGVGTLSGPLVGSAAMSLQDPDGLAWAMALASGVFLGIYGLRRLPADTPVT